MTNEKKINPAEDEMLNEEAVENVSGGRLIGDFINPIEIERKTPPRTSSFRGFSSRG